MNKEDLLRKYPKGNMNGKRWWHWVVRSEFEEAGAIFDLLTKFSGARRGATGVRKELLLRAEDELQHILQTLIDIIKNDYDA